MPGLEDEQSVNMDKLTQLQDCIEQLLLIMKLAVVQLVQRTDFKQVSPDIPVTKSRPKDKIDSPQKFEGLGFVGSHAFEFCSCLLENKRELVADLIRKAKQIELIIESLPAPEPEQAQVRSVEEGYPNSILILPQAARFEVLEQEMQRANEEYQTAVERASTYSQSLPMYPSFITRRTLTQGDYCHLQRPNKRGEYSVLTRLLMSSLSHGSRCREPCRHISDNLAKFVARNKYDSSGNIRPNRLLCPWFLVRKLKIERVDGSLQ